MPGPASAFWRDLLQDATAAASRSALGILSNGSTTGSIFYVDSVAGTAGGAGTTPATAVTTVALAQGLATASKGDIIVFMPGHAETIVATTEFAPAKVGVTYIGVGEGSARPTFTFSTNNTANIPVTAASCKFVNILCVCNKDGCTAAITVSAADATFEEIELRDGSTKSWTTPFLTTAAADRLTLRNVYHNADTANTVTTEAFSLIGVDSGLIEGCRFLGNYSTSAINLLTTASTKLVIRDCIFAETGDKTLAKLVKDTQGSSTWCLTESFDLVTGRKVYGSSGQVVQPDDGGWHFVSAASASPLTAATLWTYTGTIEAKIIGRVTTVIQGQATTVKLQVTSDALAAADLCGTKDINAFSVGSLIHIDGTPADAALSTDAVANAVGQVTPCLLTCVTSGIIKPVFGAASSGAIAWEMAWRPISRGASVV